MLTMQLPDQVPRIDLVRPIPKASSRQIQGQGLLPQGKFKDTGSDLLVAFITRCPWLSTIIIILRVIIITSPSLLSSPLYHTIAILRAVQAGRPAPRGHGLGSLRLSQARMTGDSEGRGLYTDDLRGGSKARPAGLKSWTAHNTFGLGPSGDPNRVRPSSFGVRSGRPSLHGSSCAEGGQTRNTVAPV